MKKVAVIYDSFPHYRSGIIEYLGSSKNFSYTFLGSNNSRDNSIKTFCFDERYSFINLSFKEIGPFTLQFGLLKNVLNKGFDACILLGNPYFISFWVLAPILRLLGIKVYFWTHGWPSEKEGRLKRLFRNCFFGLANGLFLYGERAKKIGILQGFSENKLHVINNSLDFSKQKQIFDDINEIDRTRLIAELGVSAFKRIIICSARLTQRCRFDILLTAVKLIKDNTGSEFQVILIGDGPEKNNLQYLADANGLDVILWGPCYDETILCKLYTVSDLTVSPGKVGLTAMHSMAYGTPVISHNNLDNQGPEFESIIPGVTGCFFEENLPDDLAKVILSWFTHHPQKPVESCISRIQQFYTPEYQRSIIESVLLNDLK